MNDKGVFRTALSTPGLLNIHIPWTFLELHVRSLLWLCVPILTEGPNSPLTPQGPLRTLSEANTGNPNDHWAILDQVEKRLEAF